MPSVEQSHPFSLRPPPAVRCTPTLLCPSLLNLLSHQPQGSSSQGVSGAMSMGSTGPGQSHSSTSPQKGLGGMPPGSSAHGLASPRKQQGQPEPGAASLRGPMLSGPPGSQMMGGGMGGGSEVVLPRMALRGREDDYGGGRGMGPNGQAMEPLSKRPRCACVCVCWVCVYACYGLCSVVWVSVLRRRRRLLLLLPCVLYRGDVVEEESLVLWVQRGAIH